MAAGYDRSNDRGVSESIGFLLIFTIMIAGIGLVTLYGYPMLVKQQVSADEKIMEKNMIVLQNDVKSLAYKTVPYKETSLKIGGGSLTVYNSSDSHSISRITINYDNEDPVVNSFSSGDLMYSSDSAGTDISLQNGAVVLRRHAEPGSVMLAEPRWFYDSPTNTMVINLVNITSDDLMAKVGIGTVRMKLGKTNYANIPNINSIIIVYNPDPEQDYSVAWDNYIRKTFSNQPGLTLDTSVPLTYKLTGSPMTLIIKQYEVKIESI